MVAIAVEEELIYQRQLIYCIVNFIYMQLVRISPIVHKRLKWFDHIGHLKKSNYKKATAIYRCDYIQAVWLKLDVISYKRGV